MISIVVTSYIFGTHISPIITDKMRDRSNVPDLRHSENGSNPADDESNQSRDPHR
jgi:hypothetical protein